MKKHLGCVISAAMAVLLIIGTANYTFNLGKETKAEGKPVLEASQSEVLVQDFIHDNYVISERNPWTDYDLHPVEYTASAGTAQLSEAIHAEAAILVQADEKTILYGKNIDRKLYPASTTKLMTALTVLQVLKPTDVVIVGEEVSMIAADSSRAGFSRGQTVTVEELLQGLLIASGNDAAYILAKAAGQAILENNIANAGKQFTASQCVQRFIFEMNKNVRDMELQNTSFTSPDGYDDREQYTTASDLSKIAMEAYQNETILKICQLQKQYSKTLDKTWTSTNQLIQKGGKYYLKECVGMKTGSTDGAGKCLVSAACSGETVYISVVLNDKKDEQRWADSRILLNYGLQSVE